MRANTGASSALSIPKNSLRILKLSEDINVSSPSIVLNPFLELFNHAPVQPPIMAKRKLETEEQKLPARDQPRKAKKHKKIHEALPRVHNSVMDTAATSTANISTESAEAERDESVYDRGIIERFEELKRAVMKEVQRQDGISEDNGQIIEEHVLQESAPISQTKKRRKHKHREGSRGENGSGEKDDQAQGNMIVGTIAPRSTEGRDKKKHKHRDRDKDRDRQKRRLRQDAIKDVLGKKKGQSAWRVSEPVAGHLGDLDPVFSPDEK